MVRATVAHLVKILMIALRIAKIREPHIRTICGRVWCSDLQKLSVEMLRKKLRFLLLHCGISTIDYMLTELAMKCCYNATIKMINNGILQPSV